MAAALYRNPHSVGFETVKSNRRFREVRCLARATLRLFVSRFHFVRSENIGAKYSRRNFAASVHCVANKFRQGFPHTEIIRVRVEPSGKDRRFSRAAPPRAVEAVP